MEECTIGSGAACGSIYLNEGFESLLRKRFEEAGTDILTEKRRTELVRQFDHTIKQSFNPFDPSAEEEFELFFGNIDDMPTIGLRDGYLSLSK